MPLVIFSFLMVLGICSATIYYFNTRETNKLNNAVNNETVKKELSEDSEEKQNVVITENASSNELENKEEPKENLKSDNPKEDNSNNSNNTIKTETPKNNESSSKNNATSKVEQNNQSSFNNSSTQSNSSNNTQIKEEIKNDSNNKEEQNNSTVYEVPDEDNKDNVSSFENDEEYIRLKALMEFETRTECQAASDVIGPQYALQGNLRNTSCESFAYKGTVIGYRLQIWFTDGTWKYNNS